MATETYSPPWQRSWSKMVFRAVDGATISTSKAKRTVTAVWSTDRKDSYNTAFIQRGIDTSEYADNPVILYEHGLSPLRDRLPIANAREFGVEKHKGRDALIGTAEFWDDEFSDARFRDYAAKPPRMRAWSVRVIPVEVPSPPTSAECRAFPDWAGAEWILRRSKLLECSAVSCPGNAGALSIDVGRSAVAHPRPSTDRLELLTGGEVQRIARAIFDGDESAAHMVELEIYRRLYEQHGRIGLFHRQDRFNAELNLVRSEARARLLRGR